MSPIAMTSITHLDSQAVCIILPYRLCHEVQVLEVSSANSGNHSKEVARPVVPCVRLGVKWWSGLTYMVKHVANVAQSPFFHHERVFAIGFVNSRVMGQVLCEFAWDEALVREGRLGNIHQL
jgi:hypothetical protein